MDPSCRKGIQRRTGVALGIALQEDLGDGPPEAGQHGGAHDYEKAHLPGI